jgi:alpha,alpha-trehalase
VENICADLATIDLNSLLYKYETDIAWTIENGFDKKLDIPSDFLPSELDAAAVGSANYWIQRASKRKFSVDKYLWNSATSRFHDYNTKSQVQTPYESITTFWALWSGLASGEQAALMVKNTLPKFEHIGGAVSTTPQPDETPGVDKRSRQWDYPFGWAPHQMTLWDGLRRYGFHNDAKRLAYKWLYLITSIAVDYNGMVLERYDVTKVHWSPGKDAEYENQGSDFRGVPMEG